MRRPGKTAEWIHPKKSPSVIAGPWYSTMLEAVLLLQGVHMVFEGCAGKNWEPNEKRQSKMVFIGRDLNKEVIREGFEKCRVKPGDRVVV